MITQCWKQPKSPTKGMLKANMVIEGIEYFTTIKNYVYKIFLSEKPKCLWYNVKWKRQNIKLDVLGPNQIYKLLHSKGNHK